MLTQSLPLLAAARAEGYAIGSYNVATVDAMAAVVRAAERERSPALAMVWSGTARMVDFDSLAAGMVSLASRADVPIALHLDHGDTLELVERSLALGFTSVMLDGADEPFEENVRLMREARALADTTGATLEGVVGEIGDEAGPGAEADTAGADGQGELTDPEQAADFVARSGVDILAIAVGTQHGHYEAPPALDVERARAIAARVPNPLVLHGGSYAPEDALAQIVAAGAAKVNVATELDDVFVAAVGAMDVEAARYASQILQAGYGAVEERVREKMRLLGSSGRA
jgi:ketose-bisphosphate aldolase